MAGIAVTNKIKTGLYKIMYIYRLLHYLTSKKIVTVSMTSEIDADDIKAEPSWSNGIGKLLGVVVLDVVTEGGCVVGGVSVITVDAVTVRVLFSGKNSQPNIGL